MMTISKTKKLVLVCLGVVAGLFVTSCVNGRSQTCGETDKEWSTNLALWHSKEIMGYDMVIVRYHSPIYGHVPFLIKVRNGKNVSMEPSRDNLGLELTDGYEAVATVEQMFDTMTRACERGDNINVTFDSTNGVPTYFGFSNIKDGTDKGDGFKLEKFSLVAK
ncbi:MAG: DUF6174 domain-containing protein [Pyrinomonadaceae bacterium]